MKGWKRNAVVAVGTLYTVGMAVWLMQDRIVHFLDSRKLDDRGFVRRVMIDDDGTEHRYIVFVPHVDPPPDCDGYPVFFFLNGHGENGEDGLLQISNNFGRPIWEMQREFPFLVVAPQCAEGGSWSREPDPSIALEVLDSVLNDYQCDDDRVYLSGVSSGGAGVFQMIQQNADRFAAVVSVAATSHGDTDATSKLLQDENLPLWSFYNGGDQPGVVDQNRALHAALQSAGCDYQVTEYDRPGHDTWNYAYRDPAVYRWLLSKSRPINQAASDFQAVDLVADGTATQNGSDAKLVDEATSPTSQDSSRQPRPDTPQDDASIDLATTRLHVSLGKNRDFDLLFEANLTEPVYVTLQPDDENEPDLSKPLHRFCLARPDQIVSQVTSQDRSCELAGSFAIRPGQWNTVRVARIGDAMTASINGWPIWDVSDGAAELSQLSIVAEHSGLSDLVDESQMASAFRRLRYRLQHDESSLMVLKTLPPTIAEATTVEIERDNITPKSIELLLARSEQSTGNSLLWKTHRVNEFASKIGDADFESSVNFAYNETHFATRRIDEDPGRMDLAVSTEGERSIVQYRPYMLSPSQTSPDFAAAIVSGFADRQPRTRVVKTFERSIKSNESIDFLDGGNEWFSKAVRRRALLDNPVSWARLTPEFNPADQLDTLHQVAAIISLGRIKAEPLAVDMSRLQRVASNQFVGGHECEVFEETHLDDDRYTRRFWIDLNAGGLVRRYYGKVVPPDESIDFEYGRPLPPMRGDVCIEINYDENGYPEGWTIINGQSKEGPLQFVADAIVKESRDASQTIADHSEQWLTEPDTWVVDQVEEQQYFTTKVGKKRRIDSTSTDLPPSAHVANALRNHLFSTASVARSFACATGLVMIGLAFKRRRKLRAD